jgi:uncharacterized membrane protein YhaH (DUF805 family)
MKKSNIIGLVLVAVGILLIVQKTIGMDVEIWSFIWPLFLIIPGISMHIKYFSERRDSSSLVVAGILTTYGLYFLFNIITGKAYAQVSSFIYPLGICIGFMESYIFGEKRSSYLSAGIVFLIVSVLVFLKYEYPNLISFRDVVIPIILILLGVLILVKNMGVFNKRD